MLLIGVSVVALFFLVAGADWLRAPSSRSHLGRFVQAIIDGNAMDIVIRKGQQNIDILLGNAPLTLLVPAALLFVIVRAGPADVVGVAGAAAVLRPGADAAGRSHRAADRP